MKTSIVLICAGFYTLITYCLFGAVLWSVLDELGFENRGGVSIYALGGAAAVGLGLAFRLKGAPP
ncbi:MAG: hypothetical protein AAF585_15035, partial [Verrucomicrobiota bacterium]